MFFLATAVGKPIHLYSATMNKTGRSCARVNVQVDLMIDLPKYMEIYKVNNDTMESRVEKVKIK